MLLAPLGDVCRVVENLARTAGRLVKRRSFAAHPPVLECGGRYTDKRRSGFGVDEVVHSGTQRGPSRDCGGFDGHPVMLEASRQHGIKLYKKVSVIRSSSPSGGGTEPLKNQLFKPFAPAVVLSPFNKQLAFTRHTKCVVFSPNIAVGVRPPMNGK